MCMQCMIINVYEVMNETRCRPSKGRRCIPDVANHRGAC